MVYQSEKVNSSKLKGFWESIITACRHTRRIYNEKQKHAFALELGKRLVKEEKDWSRYLDDRMGSPIVEATEKGIIELVNEILQKFPEAVFSFDKNSRAPNDKGKNILHIAVEQKDWNIYDLLRKKIELRDGMLVGDVDNHGNTILHLAAKLGALSFRSIQRGPLYQMICFCLLEDSKMASPTISVTRSDAFRAASDCDPRRRSSSFETVRNFWIQEGAIPLDTGGNTILHFLAMYGNAFVIQKLVDDENGNNSIVKCEDLLGRNDKGNTPLHEATRFGRKSVVEILLRKQESLVWQHNGLGETPIYVAAACGHEDVFDHLIAKVDRNPKIMTRSTDNSNLLHAAVMGEHYGLAISILESFPQLAQNPDEKGRTALYLLAQKSKSFRSGSFYYIHNYISVSIILSVHFLAVLTYCKCYSLGPTTGFIPSMVYQSEKVNSSKLKGFWESIITACRHTRRIYNEKQKHAFALELGKRLVKEEKDWSRYLDDRMGSPIVEATEKGIIELVNEILQKFPEAVFSFDKNSRAPNDKGKNILHIAVEQKDWNIYDLLRKKIELRDGMLVGDVDNHGNTILHLAAKLGALSFRSIQRGPLYQMMWDVCWFKVRVHLFVEHALE
ncbi:hypothetical protein RHSIM_Rhsim06G0042700 [Rhododendron simsii]|uniref:Uncharacterized protein n=1 Tax=Rhododendron simsii TaxID=118357 RepID=A0A834LIU3_RHOSS|nr:hypothetical protein RHSIM_Rhsim06G0042700 [Rhododendron simsii]